MTTAMSSYMALCGNEIVNAARLEAYVGNGVKPYGFDIKVPGCEGLDAILPGVDSDPPLGGYQLPDLDLAPWYDATVPESANFAGLLVTEVTISSPYSRSSTENIRQGTTLGRLKLLGRTIVVHGWLIGKTCCATQYGLKWLTTALSGPPCPEGNCGACSLEFLDCCPAIGTEEGDCLTTDAGVYVRPSADTEYQRAAEFFRHMNGVGVIDGPNVLSCKGSNCGCGSSALVEVEFTLSSSSPYFNSCGTSVLTDQLAALPCDTEDCDITWLKIEEGEECPVVDPECPVVEDCLEDPLCPLPALPPALKIPTNPCACNPLRTTRLCVASSSGKEWGSSTLNIEVFSGDTQLRNLAIRLWQNPLGVTCGDPEFTDCSACSTLLISYIPPNARFVLSGETRTVTIECNGRTRNASQNVTNVDGQPFDWPDLTCFTACICVDFDCDSTAPNATISIDRIDRDL